MNIKGHKVLVTGADGFIGSHLVEKLVEEGCAVKAFCYYNSFNSWGWLDQLPKQLLESIEIVSGDIRDSVYVEEAMKGCDIVFHLAALIAIPYSYQSPESFVDTNIKGTLNVLQAARKLSMQKIILTSSSEVYGTALYTPIDERHPFQGQSPYSATKIAADCLAESFYRSFGLPIVTVRPFNTYGPRQSARAIIPTIICQLATGTSELRLGNLESVRDLNYVTDTVRAFIEISKSDNIFGETLNVATGVGISVRDLAGIIMEIMGKKVTISVDSSRLRPQKSEVEILIGDNKKICSLTNWKSEYNLRNGLLEMIRWFKLPENIKKYKTLRYNI